MNVSYITYIYYVYIIICLCLGLFVRQCSMRVHVERDDEKDEKSTFDIPTSLFRE